MSFLTEKIVLPLKEKGITAFVYDEVSSTFDKARELMQSYDDGVVVAKRQVGGRGKGKRKFVSPDGGLYFTVFHKNVKITPSNTAKTVLNAGFGVYSQLRQLGFEAKLKWPNDVLINGKKICGILTETVMREGACDLMCGVGVNVNTKDFGEFNEVATSLFLQSGKEFPLEEIAVKIISGVESRLFDHSNPNDEFLSASGMQGKKIKVTESNNEYFCTVKGLSPDGFLIAEKDGKEIKIICGDVKEV